MAPQHNDDSPANYSFRQIGWPVVAIVTVFLFVIRCANQVPPAGGPKDTQPPQVESFFPPNNSVHFSSREIEITFKEFIRLQNAESRTYISPPLDKSLEISYRKKTLKIELPDTLRPNTTYIIHISKAIKDITEGNVREDLTYVFSTGGHIDSLKLKGTITQLPDLEPKEGVYAMLYQELSDSAFYEHPPYYFSKTNKKGKFTLPHLKPGTYQLLGLADINNNLRYDLPNEEVAFLDTSVTIQAGDTTPPSYSLRMFKARKKPLSIVRAFAPQLGKAVIILNQPVSSIKVQKLGMTGAQKKKPTELVQFSRKNDTITCWTENMYLDSARFRLYNDQFEDTVRVRFPDTKDSVFEAQSVEGRFNIPQRGRFRLDRDLVFRSETPLRARLDRPTIVIRDSVKDTVTAEKMWFPPDRPLEAHLQYNFKQKRKYKVIFPPGSLTDIYGRTNDTLRASFMTVNKRQLGTIRVSYEPDSISGSASYIVSLRKKKKEVRQAFLRKDTTVSFQYLSPGEYHLQVIVDRNQNGWWDPGHYGEKRPPETILTPEKAIQLNANWEIELQLRNILNSSTETRRKGGG